MTCPTNIRSEVPCESLRTQLSGKVALRFAPEDFPRHARNFTPSHSAPSLGITYPSGVERVRAAVLACASPGDPIVSMRRLKQALDPVEPLNPGKVLAPGASQ